MDITYTSEHPEEINEFRKTLIKYYQNQALGQRSQASIANRKKTTDKHLAKAETYDMMAIMLQKLEVKQR